MGSPDRISQLPDDVLVHILSPLPTPEVVRTSILSRRWLKLWPSIPHLRLHISDFNYDMIRFEGFIDMLLLHLHHNDRDLQSLSLVELKTRVYWDKALGGDRLTNTILLAMTRRVQDLDLFITSKPKKLPPSIFTCETLTSLKLRTTDSKQDFWILKSVRLSSLRTLHVTCLSFKRNSMQALISGCPVLEDLLIKFCRFSSLEIESLTLKVLVLFENYGPSKLCVSAPCLISLKFIANSPKECSLKNLSSLVSAHIGISTKESGGSYTIFEGLGNVSYLELESNILKHISGRISSMEQPLLFPNLNKLKLMTLCFHDTPMLAIIFFLRTAPSLEHLVIVDSMYASPRMKQFTLDPQVMSVGCKKTIKSIEIHNFRIYKLAHKFVSFLQSITEVQENLHVIRSKLELEG